MIEAGSAILQPSRALRIVQTFDTIEFVPLCQVMVAIQIMDSAKQSVEEMQIAAGLLIEANPLLERVLNGYDAIWNDIGKLSTIQMSRKIQAEGIDQELEKFLTTAPVTLPAETISEFMSPTYTQPISGQLYNKIGNILLGVAPFYLDTVLQLVDNLRNITPRVTPDELARWEGVHKNRIVYIIGVVRKPEIILDVDTFDYSFLWQENFKKMLILHRDSPQVKTRSVQQKITDLLKKKYQREHMRYEPQLETFDAVMQQKFDVRDGAHCIEKIENTLLYRDMPMNNLWFYFMSSGYVVPFIDNAVGGESAGALYGTSLGYDETCEKLVILRDICGDMGIPL
jgi:hypothetical protein